ncbi:F-box domain containing protein [Pandoravirus salinus]|uniref:F-box domain containing protein n=1 Tax=Pandoravirus salinus TaxID=1349410 RepID=S4W484_9VIRU|nr:F-box domain [Pandoravirus salinus]AGO85140.1 F-box domain containing protein [Pandoravirus salinus]
MDAMDVADGPMTLTALPCDTLLDILACMPVADIAASSMACTALYRLAMSASLWRRLFVRDYAHLYEKGLPAQPWPHKDHPDDPWHEIAVDFWKGTDAIARMPPRCPPLPHLPAPFARAFAAGKDWRWLYRVHTSTLPTKPDESFSGPVAYRTDLATIVRCDWKEGQPYGYRSIVITSADGNQVVGWSEWMFDLVDASPSWGIQSDSDAIINQAWSDRSGQDQWLFSFDRDGDRRWASCSASGHGVFVGLPPTSARNDGEYDGAGNITSLTVYGVDGCTVAQIRDGKTHGVKHSFWHNGDTMSTVYKDGEFVDAVEFVCSPACPRPEYANAKIAGCTWRRVNKIVASDNRSYIVTVPVDDSDAARLFWRYVADGLIGWDPRIRRAVMDAAAAGIV